MASSSCDGDVNIWDVKTQTIAKTLSLLPTTNVIEANTLLCKICFTVEGDYLIIPVQKSLQIYRSKEWTLSYTLKEQSITSVSF